MHCVFCNASSLGHAELKKQILPLGSDIQRHEILSVPHIQDIPDQRWCRPGNVAQELDLGMDLQAARRGGSKSYVAIFVNQEEFPVCVNKACFREASILPRNLAGFDV